MSAEDVTDVRVLAHRAGISLVGESPAFLELLRSVERIARHGGATVLIRGETGTGKEIIARAIHYLGARRDFPFVPVNCGALPDTLAENELFGHRPGAFTGATDESIGLLRLAHRGTLFLDEVDALPPKTQVALLRFLQDGSFRPLGTSREEKADVRIVAASNRCLKEEVRANRFRADLYFRLNLIALEVPPLRERAGDVRILSEHFLQECARRYRLPDKYLNDGSLVCLGDYAWPGNVRELENLIHRAYLLCDDEQLKISTPEASSGAGEGASPERRSSFFELPHRQVPCPPGIRSQLPDPADPARLGKRDQGGAARGQGAARARQTAQALWHRLCQRWQRSRRFLIALSG